MRNFRDLKVWQKAHEFTLSVYRSTQSFPADERYGLTAQVRRSSASIATNIAEGCGRNTEPDLARFLAIASGSASEAEYQLLLARDLQYLPPADHDVLQGHITEVKKMLTAFHKKLTANS